MIKDYVDKLEHLQLAYNLKFRQITEFYPQFTTKLEVIFLKIMSCYYKTSFTG